MIFEIVRKIICEQFSVRKEQVTLSSNISKDFNGDWLDWEEIAMKAEEAFDIEISDEVLDSLATVGDLVSYIDSKLWYNNAERENRKEGMNDAAEYIIHYFEYCLFCRY